MTSKRFITERNSFLSRISRLQKSKNSSAVRCILIEFLMWTKKITVAFNDENRIVRIFVRSTKNSISLRRRLKKSGARPKRRSAW
jgi:hypothetical protein